jgi:hypothetical protein
MVKTYTYKLPAKFDPPYLYAVLAREFGANFLGWSETPTEIRIEFAKELSPTEKAKLDSLLASPPFPVERLEFGALDIADEIYAAIGKRPVRVDYDETRDHAIIDFDVPLTDIERTKVETILKTRRLKKRI